ncbi:MAG: EAL domain-containing protein [Beijerinckiaceae bacterium]
MSTPLERLKLSLEPPRNAEARPAPVVFPASVPAPPMTTPVAPSATAPAPEKPAPMPQRADLIPQATSVLPVAAAVVSAPVSSANPVTKDTDKQVPVSHVPKPRSDPHKLTRRAGDLDPSKSLMPVAETVTSVATACILGAAIAAASPWASTLSLPAALATPLTALGMAGVLAQTLLAFRRRKIGLVTIQQVEARANRRGITDPLTGLANRAGYKINMEDALAARQGDMPLGVVYIDLDRFKEVNDNFGHEMGDKLLKAVTARLAEISQGRATAARLGGDEFALVVHGCQSISEITDIGASISKRMGQPFMIDSVELVIGGSVGIAIAPEDGSDYSELVRRADIAMYRAKGAGRGNSMRFDNSMEDNVRNKKIMEDELRHAVERGELEMVYQPYFAADGETIRGVEALVRWNSEKLGLVSPGDFIPLAEETGLISEIGDWTVKVALEHAKDWPDIGIAVNVSPAQFRAKALAENIIKMVTESGIDHKRIEVEVTEGVLIRDADRAAATIKQLRDAGMRVALDDFGTGFASLSYLRRFQFDKLKIDQVFVKTLSSERGGGSGSAAIIHNVVALGRSLGMTVQAEGVETLEHHIFLRAAGCHCLQGYYFARPMTKEAMDIFLNQKRGFGNSDSRYYA